MDFEILVIIGIIIPFILRVFAIKMVEKELQHVVKKVFGDHENENNKS